MALHDSDSLRPVLCYGKGSTETQRIALAGLHLVGSNCLALASIQNPVSQPVTLSLS
jgi:hypothetical protein